MRRLLFIVAIAVCGDAWGKAGPIYEHKDVNVQREMIELYKATREVLNSSGTIDNSLLDSSSVTKQGNTFNGATQLVQTNSSGLIGNSNIDGSSVTKQGNTFNGIGQLVQTNSSGALAIGTFTTTSNQFVVDCDGDLWILANASYTSSGCKFTRIDANKAAWGLEMQGAGIFPGEVDSGWVVWRATGATYGNRAISTTFGAVGGWELGMDITSNRDMVVGGGAIELDGFGTFPYGRMIHSNLSGNVLTGVGRNLYNDLSDHDSDSHAEVFVGFSSDTFIVAYSSPQVSSNLINNVTISSHGYVNQPKQPGFLAINSSVDSNVTGDNTTITVDFNSEVYDTQDNFASDIFTAPVTGKYLLSAGVTIRDTASGNKCELRMVTSNRTYVQELWPTSNVYLDISAVADMDKSDTASVQLNCSGGALVVDVLGTSGSTVGSGEPTYFSGTLLN